MQLTTASTYYRSSNFLISPLIWSAAVDLARLPCGVPCIRHISPVFG